MKITDLSLREKVLQTVVLRLNDGRESSVKNAGAAFFFGEIITEADAGGLEQATATLKRYTDECTIPMLVVSDFENGCGDMLKGLTPLPYMMGLGATNSEEIAYNYGKATALEARSVGANWTFSPVCDLNINRRNPLVNIRSVSDDPELAVKLLTQVVRGMQENGLAACAKHFPGDGMDWRDQHAVTTNNTLSWEDWKQKSGKVFQALIDAGVYSIMPGHITLPAYQTERAPNGMCLPATLSYELITKLLKGEMGFEGVVVTDALDMGGFNGWYKDLETSEIESFKAGCDMLLWPSANYVDNLVAAVESGYVSMERLDDAVSRILKMKEKLGLFQGCNDPRPMTAEEKTFVKKTQIQTADYSITLVRDNAKHFPIDPKKVKKIAVCAITHHEPTREQGKVLAEELCKRGFDATLYPFPSFQNIDDSDLVIYAIFSRPFRPRGFLDFMGAEMGKIHWSMMYGQEKSVYVSFGSPYLGEQYFERVDTYVNAYSMTACSVEAFVRAATGEIPFTHFSPVHLTTYEEEIALRKDVTLPIRD
ncbi:MAG: glycoside hydrolase family 3 protein [Oscillospiraceae bacterium]|nr:glycoside hydrolase family 3 protein [Oscillospiraceae bacterium]